MERIVNTFYKLSRIKRACCALALCVATGGLTAQTIPPSNTPTPGTVKAQSILGDTVEITYLYPNINTPYGINLKGVVSTSGLSLDLFNNVSVVVYPNSVAMVGLRDSTFTGAAFNGVSVQDLTNPSAFSSFWLNPASDVPGFSISRTSLVGGVLFINYESLPVSTGQDAQVNFTSCSLSSAVGYPGTFTGTAGSGSSLEFALSGSFGPVILGSDPLGLGGQNGQMQVTTSTTATPVFSTANSAIYSIPAGSVYLVFGSNSYYSTDPWKMTINLGASGDTLLLSGPGPTGTSLAGTDFRWTTPLQAGSWSTSVLSHPALPFPPTQANLPTPASNLAYGFGCPVGAADSSDRMN
jgi:hypothetical protein